MGCSGSKPAAAPADGKGDATLLTGAANDQVKDEPDGQTDPEKWQAQAMPPDESKAEDIKTVEARPASEKPHATEIALVSVETQEAKELTADGVKTQEAKPFAADESKATEVGETFTVLPNIDAPLAEEPNVSRAQADEREAKAEDVQIEEPQAQVDQSKQQVEKIPADEEKPEEAKAEEVQPAGAEKSNASRVAETIAGKASAEGTQRLVEPAEVIETSAAQREVDEPKADDFKTEATTVQDDVVKGGGGKTEEPDAGETKPGTAPDVMSMEMPKLEPKLEGENEMACCKCSL